MKFPFLGKSNQSSHRKRLAAQRRLTHECLEPRAMLSINPTGDDFLINDVVVGIQGVDANATSVAVSHTSGMLVAYSGKVLGSRDGIFLGRFDFEGGAQSVVQANTTARGLRSDGVVAANDAGDTVVVWQGQGVGDKYGIYLQRFDADGEAVGDETLVNQTIGGSQHNPAVAMDSDGNFVVTWAGVGASDPAGFFARRFSADGQVGDEFQINTTTVGDQSEPAIAMSRDGQYVIVWTSRDQDGDSTGVFGQRFDADDSAQGDEFQLNTTTTAQQQEAAVAMQDDGTFMAVWSSTGQNVDSWEIVGRLFTATGPDDSLEEFIVNTTTTDHQRQPQISGARGKYLVTWQSGILDGSGWEVMSQDFDTSGTRLGTETLVNSDLFGLNSGHQEHPAVALNAAGRAAIVWSGNGSADRQGVFGRNLLDEDAVDENSQPNLLSIERQYIDFGEEFEFVVTATDADDIDSLTFTLGTSISPDEAAISLEGATITRNEDDPRTATIRWTPTPGTGGLTEMVALFRVTVTDDGIGQLSDTEEFAIEVDRLTVDLNGQNEAGEDATAEFVRDLGPALIADQDLFIRDAENDEINFVSIALANTPDGSFESLAVDTLDTNIVGEYSSAQRLIRLSSSGAPESAENYERVLRTLTYDNTAANPTGTRTVQIRVNDTSGALSNTATITVDLGPAYDLVGLAAALSEANVQFFGAAWAETTTEQRELFGDGAQFLPFTEVTSPDRTLDPDIADPNGIITPLFPVWVFEDGTRLLGVQTPETLAAQLGIEIPLSTDPTFVEVPDQTLRIGSPLHVSLDGYDPTGGPLTYSVATDRPDLVDAEILSGNRSARVSVEGYGDMVFELFEERASRATARFIAAASDDLFGDGEANNDFFYDDVIFHRIIDDFVIQGGDPTGTGSGGTDEDFDDQFHVDLQHNRTGLLSFAKSPFDDTNDTQFFITEGASSSLRNLDFHHSIFGVLTEGEEVRAAISDTSVIRNQADVDSGDILRTDSRLNRPGNRTTEEEFNITMSNVEIFEDTENAVLFLKAITDAAIGEVVEVTVTVTDVQGNSFDQTFSATLTADTVDGTLDTAEFNGTPFLDDIESPITIDSGTSAVIQLAASDVEGDDVEFGARLPREIVNGTSVIIDQPNFDFDVDATTGEVTVTPTDGFTGTLLLEVQVGAVGIGSLETVSDSFVDRQVMTIIVE